jgi:hypothetical protein
MYRVLPLVLVVASLLGCNNPSGPLFSRAGTGNDVFTVPSQVKLAHITGQFAGSSSNFIIWIDNDLVVNELLGTFWEQTSYAGTHAVRNGQARVEDSTGVTWTFTEVRE